MKLKKLFAMGLAVVMTAALVLAAEEREVQEDVVNEAVVGAAKTEDAWTAKKNNVTISSQMEDVKIAVTIPGAAGGKTVINPYKLPVELSVAGSKLKSTDGVFSNVMTIVNKTQAPLAATVSIAGTASKFTLAATPSDVTSAKGDDATPTAYAYVAFYADVLEPSISDLITEKDYGVATKGEDKYSYGGRYYGYVVNPAKPAPEAVSLGTMAATVGADAPSYTFFQVKGSANTPTATKNAWNAKASLKIKFVFTFTAQSNDVNNAAAAVKFELPDDATKNNGELDWNVAKATLNAKGDMRIPAASFPTYSCDSGGTFKVKSWTATDDGTPPKTIRISQPTDADKGKAVTISAENLKGVGATNVITLTASSDSGGDSFN